ncbi:hypothetical protein MAPG_00149 [Magnaporthiopsis poae ATCC 64411]|uniref:AB hydrolase-1 domain-containing protein n=1 Tax=Magnaporthiopsis poae (strain ATCC 64411 / 73-15) TaxID=644358 RepID=A0A0C4DK86_MAGP6|nr:hypothetical protein MAPG_00149 [Magnaporthiopsis poae ATCC 64411]
MIGDSLRELVLIRVAIFFLNYSIPVGLALLVALQCATGAISWWLWPGAGPGPSSFSQLLTATVAAIVALDTAFALAVYLPYKRRAERLTASPPPTLSRLQRQKLFDACFDNISDCEAYLRGWFLGADIRDIRRDNVHEFLTWAFFDRDSSAASATGVYGPPLDQGQEEELQGYLDEIDRRLRAASSDGVGLLPGHGPARSLRLSIDEVHMRFRSSTWYLIVMAVDIFTHLTLTFMGFKYHAPHTASALDVLPPRPQLWLPKALVPRGPSPSASMAYWHRPHTSRTRKPVLFIHGIGIGLLPYMKFMSEVAARDADAGDDGQVGIIALEILPISMRFSGAPLNKEAFLKSVSDILGHHGWATRNVADTGSVDNDGDDDDGFVLVSHSYGSVLTTHILRDAALSAQVSAAVLVDPVSLLLHMPEVAFNFTRRLPRRANEWQLWFFASMDPSTAVTLARYFFWQHNLIWKEELLSRPPRRAGREHAAEDADAHAPVSANDDNDGLGRDKQLQTGWATDFSCGPLARGADITGPAGAAPPAGVRKRKVAVSLAGWDIILDARRVAEYLLRDGDKTRPTWSGEETQATSRAGFQDGEIITPSGPGPLPPAATGDEGDGTAGYMTASGIEILYFPTLDHAQVFDNDAERRRVVHVVRRYCRD